MAHILLCLLAFLPTTTHGHLDAAFLQAVEPLYMHTYGTEAMAPMLYSLIRFHRPLNVVEFGGGYSTPFIARGLAENVVDAENELNDHPLPIMLHDEWYSGEGSEVPSLTVIDDGSQDDSRNFKQIMESIELPSTVHIEFKHGMRHSDVSDLPPLNSVGLIWNDAQWDPEYIKNWWPILKNDGGLMLLHNVIGNAPNNERWAVGSPRRIMKELFPDERFEFMTLIEPHKRYQGELVAKSSFVDIKKRVKMMKQYFFDTFYMAERDVIEMIKYRMCANSRSC